VGRMWPGGRAKRNPSVGLLHGESPRADAGVADHNQGTCGEIAGDLFEVRENDCGEGSGSFVRRAGAG
jgi:hypothetical protein